MIETSERVGRFGVGTHTQRDDRVLKDLRLRDYNSGTSTKIEVSNRVPDEVSFTKYLVTAYSLVYLHTLSETNGPC